MLHCTTKSATIMPGNQTQGNLLSCEPEPCSFRDLFSRCSQAFPLIPFLALLCLCSKSRSVVMISQTFVILLSVLICDPLCKNRPLAIFHENRVLGIGRRRIYCRVQRSKSQPLKRFLSQVMAKKLYTGHPCLSSQFFNKRRVLYVHSSTFNVSVYAPYYTTRLTP